MRKNVDLRERGVKEEDTKEEEGRGRGIMMDLKASKQEAAKYY